MKWGRGGLLGKKNPEKKKVCWAEKKGGSGGRGTSTLGKNFLSRKKKKNRNNGGRGPGDTGKKGDGPWLEKKTAKKGHGENTA